MRHAYTAILNHRLEIREGDFSTILLVNGKPAQTKWLKWFGCAFFLDLEDENGSAHVVEVRLAPPGLRRTKFRILVDGEHRQELTTGGERSVEPICRNCGYSLIGLEVEQGERRCPECGRHTPI